MVRFAVASALLLGCSTTSRVGAFVHDIHVVDTGLDVTSCDVAVTIGRNPLDGSEHEHATRSGCTTTHHELPVTVVHEDQP